MDKDSTKYIVMGVVGLVVLANVRRLFTGIGDALGVNSEADKVQAQQDAKDVQKAIVFDDPAQVPELWQSSPLVNMIRSGRVSQAMVDALHAMKPKVATAAVAYHDAKGTVWDNEEQAVSAVGSMPDYLSLLWMAETFYIAYGMTMGAYGSTFLEPADKARIVTMVTNLRQQFNK